MTTKRITHVIFDLDGLLINTESLYAKANHLVSEQYGKFLPEQLKFKLLGLPGLDIAETIIKECQLPISVEEYGRQFDKHYNHLACQSPIPLMPGANRLVRHLYKHRVPIAVATGSMPDKLKMNIAPHKEFISLFDHVLVSHDDPQVTKHKPDPEPYAMCAKRFRQPPENNSTVLVFEDSLVGIESAKRAGMVSIWVPSSPIPESNLFKVSEIFAPDFVLSSLEQFQPELFNLPSF